jgi:four helix bundle protein
VDDKSKAKPPKRDLCRRTFEFSLRIVKVCQELEKSDGVARTLGRQLLRSGTSIGANVEEGQGSQSRVDFASKYAIARKEARETQYWIRIIGASGIIPEAKLAKLPGESAELTAILTAIVKKKK